MRTLLLTLALAATAQAQFEILPSPTTADLRGIQAVTPEIAWASGANGTVLRTVDAGAHWAICPIPPGAETLDFRGIQAFDAQTAIVMSTGEGPLSRLYKTTDACQSWRLVFTNPDPEGSWSAIAFEVRKPEATTPDWRAHLPGIILGDPVRGNFAMYDTPDSGQTWIKWENDAQLGASATVKPANARKGEAVFAASNSSLLVPGVDGPMAFVTGGKSGSRLLLAQPHSPFDNGTTWKFSAVGLKFPSAESAGAFSIEARRVGLQRYDLMVVGGDYKRPDAVGASTFLPYRTDCCFGLVPHKQIVPSTPPHGFRSSVAYSPDTKTWITVGPNGTDISTDDGRTWRPLTPSAGDAPDADKNWNALSLPYVVGPHGRIGKLRPQALP